MKLKSGKMREKINETKSWLLGKTNKIDKPLAGLTMTKTEKTEISSIENERENIAIDSTDMRRII